MAFKVTIRSEATSSISGREQRVSDNHNDVSVPWANREELERVHLTVSPGVPVSYYLERDKLAQAHENLSLVSDIFGVGSATPRNYTPRTNVDDALAIAIARGRHVVVHGSSKQGKTCLRKNYLRDESSYIAITCMPGWTLADLHGQILKTAGYGRPRQDIVTASGERKTTKKISGKVKALTAEISAEFGSDASSTNQKQRLIQYPEVDLSDPNDVVQALRSIDFRRVVVLEDFHYLNKETQRLFALALKAYHDSGYVQFLIVGVWLDQNRLIHYNGDLSGRVDSVNADVWTSSQLLEVMKTGASMIGIEFDEAFMSALIEESRHSVWIVQEVCYLACQRAGIIGVRPALDSKVGTGYDVKESVRQLIDPLSSRFLGAIGSISNRGRARQDTRAWIMAAILVADSDVLASGLSRDDLQTFLDRHGEGPPVRKEHLSRILNGLTTLQAQNDITPIVFDYDQSSETLNVVDRSFLLWLTFQRNVVQELLAAVKLPRPAIRALIKETMGAGRHRA